MKVRIRDLPPDERPRERLWRSGPAALSAAELIALLLGSGDGNGRNALELAGALLASYGGPTAAGVSGFSGASGASGINGGSGERHSVALATMGVASAHELVRVPGIGPAKAARLVAAIELGRRASGVKLVKPSVRCPKDIADLFADRMRRLDREHFYAVMLDTKNQVIGIELISIGSLDASLVHPRELFKAAVKHSAAGVVLIHNHPSGDPTPSEADVSCTARLQQAGRVLGIGILDHLVIGDGDYVSFRESGIGGLQTGVE